MEAFEQYKIQGISNKNTLFESRAFVFRFILLRGSSNRWPRRLRGPRLLQTRVEFVCPKPVVCVLVRADRRPPAQTTASSDSILFRENAVLNRGWGHPELRQGQRFQRQVGHVPLHCCIFFFVSLAEKMNIVYGFLLLLKESTNDLHAVFKSFDSVGYCSFKEYKGFGRP